MNYSLVEENPSLKGKKYRSGVETGLAVLLASIAMMLLGVFIHSITKNSDWVIFSNAANSLEPFSVKGGYFNPVFILPIIYPFAQLPYKIGGAVWGITCLIVAMICVIQLSDNNKMLRVVLALTCLPIVAYLDMSQIGVISLVGITILEKHRGNWLGAILVISKPQLFAMSMFLWLKDSNWLNKILVSLVFIGSFFIYGNWPMDMVNGLMVMGANIRPNNLAIFWFPYGVIAGLIIMYIGYKKDSYLIMALSTPLFFPYFSSYSLFPFLAYVYGKIGIKKSVFIYLVIQAIIIFLFLQVI